MESFLYALVGLVVGSWLTYFFQNRSQRKWKKVDLLSEIEANTRLAYEVLLHRINARIYFGYYRWHYSEIRQKLLADPDNVELLNGREVKQQLALKYEARVNELEIQNAEINTKLVKLRMTYFQIFGVKDKFKLLVQEIIDYNPEIVYPDQEDFRGGRIYSQDMAPRGYNAARDKVKTEFLEGHISNLSKFIIKERRGY